MTCFRSQLCCIASFILYLFLFIKKKSSLYGLPPKPHIFTNLPLQGEFLNVYSLISDLPSEIQNLILDHLGANNSDIKSLIKYTLADFDRLEKSFYDNLCEQDCIDKAENHYLKTGEFLSQHLNRNSFRLRDAYLYEQQQVHIALQESVSKEVSKLIHRKALYESITKDYSLVNGCIDSFNSQRMHKSSLEISSIKDMIQNLESYKVWTQNIKTK